VHQGTVPRTMGTPQGGCVNSVLSNLFLHYVFDAWMLRHYPKLQWCRYADDGLVHCSSRYEAEKMLRILQSRFEACGLKLHPGKTRIVCCDRRYKVPKDCAGKFTFLGYTFRMRKSKAQDLWVLKSLIIMGYCRLKMIHLKFISPSTDCLSKGE
jgi:RNA-directed DNA polymerase